MELRSGRAETSRRGLLHVCQQQLGLPELRLQKLLLLRPALRLKEGADVDEAPVAGLPLRCECVEALDDHVRAAETYEEGECTRQGDREQVPRLAGAVTVLTLCDYEKRKRRCVCFWTLYPCQPVPTVMVPFPLSASIRVATK